MSVWPLVTKVASENNTETDSVNHTLTHTQKYSRKCNIDILVDTDQGQIQCISRYRLFRLYLWKIFCRVEIALVSSDQLDFQNGCASFTACIWKSVVHSIGYYGAKYPLINQANGQCLVCFVVCSGPSHVISVCACIWTITHPHPAHQSTRYVQLTLRYENVHQQRNRCLLLCYNMRFWCFSDKFLFSFILFLLVVFYWIFFLALNETIGSVN